jgi:hypothetical protein
MTKPFFVMIYAQSGEGGFAVTDENDEIMFWATEREAEEAMKDHWLASKLGFRVFEM